MRATRKNNPRTRSQRNNISESFRAQLLDSLFDGVYFVDNERRITYWNKAAEELTGYSAKETVGRFCFDNLLAHVDCKGTSLCKGGCPLWQTIEDGKRRQSDIYLRHKQGHRVPVCVRIAPIRNESRIIGAVEVFGDASAKHRVENRVHELERFAFKDSLTSLPNRRYTEMKLKQALEECREFGRTFGVMLLDIDCFKGINDTHGHDAGDAVLRAFAGTLAQSLRRDDDFPGRWGGDEFLLLVADVDSRSLRRLAERCRVLVRKSGTLINRDGRPITVSIGATLTKRGDSPELIIKRADELMYRSKADGRNRTSVE